jgi:hypothetical protein
MILQLTPKTATLIGETPAEWELLEQQARAGRWTSGLRTDEGRLRALAAELGVPVREEASCDGSGSRGHIAGRGA